MPRVHDVVPLFDVDDVAINIVEALTAHLQFRRFWRFALSTCNPLRVLFLAHEGSGSSLIVHAGGIVSFLFLRGACSAFCSLDWVVMACLLVLSG